MPHSWWFIYRYPSWARPGDAVPPAGDRIVSIDLASGRRSGPSRRGGARRWAWTADQGTGQ